VKWALAASRRRKPNAPQALHHCTKMGAGPDITKLVHVFKRAQRGLYAGRTRLSGNHVSPSKRQ